MSGKASSLGVEAVVWILLCLGLAVGLGIETDWGKRTLWPVSGADEVVPAAFDRPRLSPPYELPSADQYLEIAMRPLFIVTRRPAPERPPQEPPKPQMQKGQYALAGIMLIGATKFAQLIQKAGNKSLIVTEGKDLGGIAVREINSNNVVLTQFDDSEVLMLQAVKPAAPGTPPPAVPRAPSGPPPVALPPGGARP